MYILFTVDMAVVFDAVVTFIISTCGGNDSLPKNQRKWRMTAMDKLLNFLTETLISLCVFFFLKSAISLNSVATAALKPTITIQSHC